MYNIDQAIDIQPIIKRESKIAFDFDGCTMNRRRCEDIKFPDDIFCTVP